MGSEIRFEEYEPASPVRVSYRVERVLERRCGDQEILVFDSPGVGRVLALDGIVQVAEADAFAYHEVLAHPALFAHPRPRRVVIVGGGDGHLLAEVLKHPGIEQVVVLERSPEVVEVARRHFPAAQRAFADPRVELRPCDAYEGIARVRGADVVLCDLTDPVGPAARLFGQAFYARCAAALGDPGVIVAQTESLHFHRDVVRRCASAMAEHFARVSLLWTAMATYPGAWWTFTAGTTGPDLRVVRRRPEVETRLYDPEAHEWFFVPEVVAGRLLGD